MSTRSNVGIKNGSRVVYSYVHYDGYLSGVGKHLVNYYNSEEAANRLATLGDQRCLGTAFEDNDEIDNGPIEIGFEHYVPSDVDFIYLWMDGDWYYKDYKKDSWKLVKENL